MVLLQPRPLAFGLRSTSNAVNNAFAANQRALSMLLHPPASSMPPSRRSHSTREIGASPRAYRHDHDLQGVYRSAGVDGGDNRRTLKRPWKWWGSTHNYSSSSSSSSSTRAEGAPRVSHLQLQHRHPTPICPPVSGTRLTCTSTLDEVEGTNEDGEEGGGGEENEGDILLASLADELVSKGDVVEEDEGTDGWELESIDAAELDAAELEALGISMLDDESAEEVQEQLRREWGTVSVQNEQSDFVVDTAELESKLRQAMVVLGCQAWDVGAVLTTDKEVSRLNRQYRAVASSTDILSFPNNDMSNNPGILPEVRFPAEMDLGDMFISLAYVDRQIKRDREEQAAAAAAARAAAASANEMEGTHEEHEWWDSERGVSGAMSRTFDVQERASMLLVHGLIHLLGYDHETQQDYEAMVAVEEKVLQAVFGKA